MSFTCFLWKHDKWLANASSNIAMQSIDQNAQRIYSKKILETMWFENGQNHRVCFGHCLTPAYCACGACCCVMEVTSLKLFMPP